MTAHRVVYYVAHWGSDPSHTWNGTHQFGAAWELRGVGVANRYGVRLLDGGAVVRGGAVTYDDVTVVDPLGPRTPRCARAAAADKQIVEYVSQGRTPEEIGRFALARSPVRLSITSPNRLDIHPGQVPFVVHCSETEDLAAHGLTWSPGFDVPAPLRSRFRGRTTFNYYCSDDYTHKDSRHEFTGLSKFRITIAPFPLKSLKANRTALRNAIGTEPVRREFRPGDFLPDPNARDCG